MKISITKSDIKLGLKGSKPPKKQFKPRRLSKLDEMQKFIINFNGGDAGAAVTTINSYNKADEKSKDLILNAWICGKNLPLRMAKSIFKVGAGKYKRIKEMRIKKKSGGIKPSAVRLQLFIRLKLLKSNLRFHVMFKNR